MKRFILLLLALLFSGLSLAAVNINTATVQELEALNGIGPVKAQAIIDHRKANGPFKSIEQIKDVKGVGDATFDKIKGDIAVSGATKVPAAAAPAAAAPAKAAAPAAAPAAAGASVAIPAPRPFSAPPARSPLFLRPWTAKALLAALTEPCAATPALIALFAAPSCWPTFWIFPCTACCVAPISPAAIVLAWPVRALRAVCPAPTCVVPILPKAV